MGEEKSNDRDNKYKNMTTWFLLDDIKSQSALVLEVIKTEACT